MTRSQVCYTVLNYAITLVKREPRGCLWKNRGCRFTFGTFQCVTRGVQRDSFSSSCFSSPWVLKSILFKNFDHHQLIKFLLVALLGSVRLRHVRVPSVPPGVVSPHRQSVWLLRCTPFLSLSANQTLYPDGNLLCSVVPMGITVPTAQSSSWPWIL